MATKSISRTDLIGLTSLSFIRPQRITFKVAGTKPSTRLYAFFDGIDVGKYITPNGGSLGGNIVSNAAGELTGTFDVPPATFNTGSRIFKLQDSPAFDITAIPGSIQGKAEATFTSSGLLQTFQQTVTNITEQIIYIENNIIDAAPVVAAPATFNFNSENDTQSGGGDAGDPLAQTFFTYGIVGGCFITKIDIYFQSKDANIPVTLELRNVANGYPASTLVSKYSTVTLPPTSVGISNTSSVATTFVFPRPIYLAEDSDYCFVLKTNSNSYNVWTSKFGDKSIETGKTIFEQPYIGSLFKSENNKTWTAEQTEDIKFTMYQAKFTVGELETTYKVNAQPTLLDGEDFSVTTGSPVVSVKFKFQHGHRTGDKIVLTGITNGWYRGITSAVISNVAGFSLTVIDEYNATFSVGANATSTGTLTSSGVLNAVLVDSSGSGYVSPSITFANGGGAGAAATAVVVGGKIVSVTVTNPGTGYTSVPTLTLTDASGTGAVLTPISETIFVSALNRKYQSVSPIVSIQTPPNTGYVNTIRTSSEDYVIGQHEPFILNTSSSTNKAAVIVNSTTETTMFGTNPSTQMILRLNSTNSNVSPIIDLSELPKLRMNNFLINGESNSASELTPNSGTAQSRYISKIITVMATSKGVRCIVNAFSDNTTSFDVFIRTSLVGNSTPHKDGVWVKLNCDVSRNLSTTESDFRDYTFYMDNIIPFNTYDLKIVLFSTTKYKFPIIANYRNIILAS